MQFRVLHNDNLHDLYTCHQKLLVWSNEGSYTGVDM